METLRDKMGFERVTKTQAAVVPLFMANKDVCVKACTGSGKTLAFGIPLVQTLLKFCGTDADSSDSDQDEKKRMGKDQVVGLLLAPSRELAM